MLFGSMNSHQRYLRERKEQDEVFNHIADGKRVVTILSDLGNGKSLFLSGLRLRALEHGFRVFEVHEHNDEAASELDLIAQLPQKVLVTIDGYQDWLTEIGRFVTRGNPRTSLVVTARNAVNDIVFDDLQRESGLDYIPEISLDILDDSDINWFVDSFDEYGLWGNLAAKTRAEKIDFIKITCKRQMHALLLKVVESQDIGQRLRDLTNSIKPQRDKYEILLGICVMTMLEKMPTLDNLVDIFGNELLMSTQFRKDQVVKQFLDFAQNQILVKSPIAARYILQNVADPAYTVSMLSKMAKNIHNAASASKYYASLFRNFMMFSNLQTVLPLSGKPGAIITYYESVKNLPRCTRNPLFWLQYAIACIVIDDLFRAGRYFKNAYAFADKTDFNTFQIDNHYARYLLLDAVQNLEPKDAMNSFYKARSIINRQIREEKRHFAYRVASHYQLFFDHFKTSLSNKQLREIDAAAKDVLEMIERLPQERSRHRNVRDCEKSMHYITARVTDILDSKPDGADKPKS